MSDKKAVAEAIRQMDNIAREISRRCGYCSDYLKHDVTANLQNELCAIKQALAKLEEYRDKISDGYELRADAMRAIHTIHIGGFRQKAPDAAKD